MIHRTLRRSPATGLALALAVAGLLLGAASAQAQSTLERIKERGTVRIAFANEAPFGYRTMEGEVTGEAPEVAKEIFRRMGVPKVEAVLTEWGSLIPGLQAGRFDVIAAGMYVLPKRCRQIAFSEPTYCLGEGFVVARGNPRNLRSYADVREDDDAVLGVMAGAVEADIAKAVGIPQDRVRVYPDGPSAVSAVRAGRVDAYAGTALTVRDLAKKGGAAVEPARPFEQPTLHGHPIQGCGAFGFRKADTALREAFNAQLEGFVGTGEHMELVEPFGFLESEMPPPDLTTEELCNRQPLAG